MSEAECPRTECKLNAWLLGVCQEQQKEHRAVIRHQRDELRDASVKIEVLHNNFSRLEAENSHLREKHSFVSFLRRIASVVS